MADEWFYRTDAAGEAVGPVPASELLARAAAGLLPPSAQVRTGGGEWQPATVVPGLSFDPPVPATDRHSVLQDTVVSGVSGLSAFSDVTPVAVPVIAVSGYVVLDTLGTGAHGIVYRARDTKLDREVAIKTVLVPERATADVIERFESEARALARLHHPNIVVVYDTGRCERPAGFAYLAMELLTGEDLDDRIARAGPLDERTVWLVARQVAAALAHAGERGVVHRDIKPANLFLTPPPTGAVFPPGVPMVKVTDFGLALTHGVGIGTGSSDYAIVGTPVYMAPEQFGGGAVDHRADIYALGATVYHALTGAPPFDARTTAELLHQKAYDAPRLPAERCSEATADLVAAMLARDPAARPATYADLFSRIDKLPFFASGSSASGRFPVRPFEVTEPAPEGTAAPIAPAAVLAETRESGFRLWVLLLGAALGLALAAVLFLVLAGVIGGK